MKFAAWLADAPAPSAAEQAEVATRLAGTPINYDQIKRLRRREDFREVVAKIQQGGIEAARAIFVSDLPLYAELHRWAAEHAKEQGDHRGMATITTPALDRILPKKDSLTLLQPHQIVVHLNQKQLASMDAPGIEVTGEALDYSPAPPPPPALPRPNDRKTVTPEGRLLHEPGPDPSADVQEENWRATTWWPD